MTSAVSALVVIIGYGNTLRSDDGFGPMVAERLTSVIDDSRVRVLVRQLLTAELAVDLARARLCLLIDAATAGEPGILTCREVLPEATELGTLGHDLSTATLLGLTESWAGCRPECFIYSTAAQSLELGETLSPAVAALVDVAVSSIAARVSQFLAREYPTD